MLRWPEFNEKLDIEVYVISRLVISDVCSRSWFREWHRCGILCCLIYLYLHGGLNVTPRKELIYWSCGRWPWWPRSALQKYIKEAVGLSLLYCQCLSHVTWSLACIQPIRGLECRAVFCGISLHWCAVYSAGQYWILARANIQYWPAEYTVHQERKTTSTSAVPHTKHSPDEASAR